MRAYGTLEASIQIFLEDVAVRPITPEICALGALFPDDYSHDPADRIIGGTARAEGLTLITHDEKIRKKPAAQDGLVEARWRNRIAHKVAEGLGVRLAKCWEAPKWEKVSRSTPAPGA